MNGSHRIISTFAAALLTLASAASAGIEGVELRLLANGLAEPVALAHAGDDRIFIAEQAGRIRVLKEGALLDAPFLDLRSRVRFGGEQGLLGLAFHPGYAVNGRLFVNYTRSSDGATVISRFDRSAIDPDRGNPGSEAVLLVVPQPYDNHNGGQLAFGPDGQLYAALGDGGAGGDPQCRAQNLNDRLGKILRLNVDAHVDSPPYHAPSAGNPFLGGAVADDLVWALGLRNPWRLSFDRKSGDLFIADVGQGSFDEIDFQPASVPAPLNFGWKIMEGSSCYSRDACPASAPLCNSGALTLPILENDLAGTNCAVIGGYAYRGHRLPVLEGRYLFGDFCSGRIWVATESGGAWSKEELSFTVPNLTTFGETRVGEILLATLSGQLYTLDRPVSTDCTESTPTRTCLFNGRFEVEVSFRDYELDRGDGKVVVYASDSVLLWYFNPANWEQIVKVIDGCGYNQRYWVYGAAATDVETVVRVTDTLHGVVREYNNSLGVEAPALTDSEAFATCP